MAEPSARELGDRQAEGAAIGAKTKVTPSATPPVECLSTVGTVKPVNETVSPEAIIALVMASVSSASSPWSRHAMRKAAANGSPTSPSR